MRFQPPDSASRERAIGPTGGLPGELRRAFEPAGDFAAVPMPGPNDWLANHPEPGQSYPDFVRSDPNRPTATRSRLYLQPLGTFSGSGPSLEELTDFARAFFALDVCTLPPLDRGGGITTRSNPYTGQRQLLTSDVLGVLRRRLPGDAFALLGVTMEDLYPDPAWNFVFGQASLRERVGVFSFARYDPAFYGDARTDDRGSLLLRRSCKVLAHEMAHMFGIGHCVYFHCLMNGSNHLEESDARPLHLCPVDLRKLHWSIGFDLADRYRRLRACHERLGFSDEAEWIRRRLERT